MKQLKNGAKLPVGCTVSFPQLELEGMVVEENVVQYVNGYCIPALTGQHYSTKKKKNGISKHI